MTSAESLLLKQWIICEELRRADDVESMNAQFFAHPTEKNARLAAETLAAYNAFCDFARKLDALLHLFP